MEKDGILQKVLMIVFGVGILAGVIVFAIGSSKSGQEQKVTVVVWGVVPRGFIMNAIESMNQGNKDITVAYTQKSPEVFHAELLDALASGFGPDVIIYPSQLLGRFVDKVAVIPYAQYPINTFQSQYVDAGSVALIGSGVAAFPLAVDPMVMYFNRDILLNNFLTRTPQYWDEVLDFTKTVTRRNGLEINQSAIALGSLRNVSHGKSIFSLISMQAGNNLTAISGNRLIAILQNPGNSIIPPVESALSFFLQFSNTQSDVYTWNSGLPRSLDMFLAGNLGLYLGFSSEMQTLRQRNPNLNFDIAMVPQLRSTSRQMTFANVLFVSTTKVSRNPGQAQQIMFQFLMPELHQNMVNNLGYQSARREILAVRSEDPYQTMFQNSAMISRTWLDPVSEETDIIFERMMNSVVSGAENITGAVKKANEEMSRLISTRIRLF